METPESKPACRHRGRGAIGLIVIAVGVLFLLRNFGIILPFMQYHNWWALFILICAIGPLAYAAQRYRAQGKVDGVVLHSLVSAAVIVTIALVFLLQLSWNRWWPLFIIFGGLWMVANSWRRNAARTK